MRFIEQLGSTGLLRRFLAPISRSRRALDASLAVDEHHRTRSRWDDGFAVLPALASRDDNLVVANVRPGQTQQVPKSKAISLIRGAMSSPIVVTACMSSSSESWEP
jgi:hypothetical protein